MITKGQQVIDPGICRCCGATKKCRILNVEYHHQGQKEVYSDIFDECFSLVLSHLDGDVLDQLICAMCVSRLREANAFRRQVLHWEENFLNSRIIKNGEAPEFCVIPFLLSPCVCQVTTAAALIHYATELLDYEYCVLIYDLSLDDVSDDSQSIEAKLPVKNESEHRDTEPRFDDFISCSNNYETSNLNKEDTVMKSKSIKRTKTNIVSKNEHLHSKELLLMKIQITKERLNSAQNLSHSPKTSQQPIKKFVDNDKLNFQNNVTVIENSFVCPFHTSYSTYGCVYCDKTFLDPSKLREHTLKHDPVKFKTFIYRKAVYLDIDRIDCRLCDKSMDDLQSLKAHLSMVHGKMLHDVRDNLLTFKLRNDKLSCTECGQSYSFFHALKRHMAVHSGAFVCDVCGLNFFNNTSLDVHNKKHHLETDKIPCTDCGKFFKLKHNMLAHVSAVHKREAAFQCSKCDLKLYSQKERWKHLSKVHGEERQYNCGCGKVFNSLKTLRDHDRRVHLKIFNHQCSICNRGFSLPSRLNKHIMSAHRGECSFHCELCGKSYPRLHYLKRHLQSHGPHVR
ncbi:unnamed protein product [Diatraea saccharalis]|uniref:Uncharacterized protein n=1 Tax=Diatraea saccharalis TaxID=40085 RepID=A0A9N9R4S2_9NEOP|nr:unnamed protein product [Diatraea saccharalis]